MHPSSHPHSLYNSLYPGFAAAAAYPTPGAQSGKLQTHSPPPGVGGQPPPATPGVATAPARHVATTATGPSPAHCPWPSSHSVQDILAGVHAAAAFRGSSAAVAAAAAVSAHTPGKY